MTVFSDELLGARISPAPVHPLGAVAFYLTPSRQTMPARFTGRHCFVAIANFFLH